MENFPVHLKDVFEARQRIQSSILRTPLIHSTFLSNHIGVPVYLKLENLQITGSFKFRGALNKIISLTDEEKARGLITVSSGNHGKAVAWAAHHLGIPATVCLSDKTPKNKIEGIRRFGVNTVIEGGSYDEAEEVALNRAKEHQLVFIDSFDDPLVIAGQGTIGLELFEELSDFENIFIPLSGGGLASGVSLFTKTSNPAVKIFGVQMERAPVMYTSLKAGRPLHLPEEATLADGLKGGIGMDNRFTFNYCKRYLDEILLVSEEEIARAMAILFRDHHLVIEGSGAVGVAALLSGRIKPAGKTVVILSGSNVEIPVLLEIMARYKDID